MTAKFTPGPWKACTGSHGDSCICGLVWSAPADKTVASACVDRCPVLDHGDCSPPTDESKANCTLIAAAPDLYAACEAAMLACQDNLREHGDDAEPGIRDAFNKCKAALAKARGEASP